MSAKEVGTIVLNCVIAACLFGLVAVHTITLKQAIASLAFLLVPSAAPGLIDRVRDALGKGDGPPSGASVIHPKDEKDGNP